MQPGIGGADAPAPDIGSLLASGAGGGAPAAGGPGMAPDPNGMLQDALMQVRNIGQAVDAFTSQYPATAQTMGQVATLLKQAVIQLAQAQPTATPSGMSAPGGGM